MHLNHRIRTQKTTSIIAIGIFYIGYDIHCKGRNHNRSKVFIMQTPASYTCYSMWMDDVG